MIRSARTDPFRSLEKLAISKIIHPWENSHSALILSRAVVASSLLSLCQMVIVGVVIFATCKGEVRGERTEREAEH